LTIATRDIDDLPVRVRRRGVRRALLVAAAALLGCRGAGKEEKPPAPPADEQLAWPAIDEPALVASIATRGFSLGTPIPLAITPDGAVLFRRTRPRDRSADLYQLDAAGKTTVLATAATLLAGAPPAPDAGAGIETISVSDDGARVLVPLAGRLFLIERTTGASRELAIGAHHDPQLSPDGKRVGFVRDGDLWVATIGEGAPVRVAQHPSEQGDARPYATPDAIARAFGRDRGFWWSPDSQSLAFERRDARAVESQYIADPRHPEQAPVTTRIPRAGKTLATVDLGIVSVHGGAPRWVTWEIARYPYLARVIWPARGPLTLIAVGRQQTVAAVITVDAATGATHPILVDKDPIWLTIAPDALTWLPDGSGFLWLTQAGGAWTLEHHAADGTHVRTVVTPDLGVRRVVGLMPDGQGVVIEGANDPREQHIWRAPLAGGEPVALTSGGGVHTALTGHGVIAITSRLRAGGQVTAALRADGSRVELPSVAERPASAPTTKIENLVLDDHAQYAAITRPRAFDPKVRYPVLLRTGTDANAKVVLDALDTYRADQWYADAGFIVVRSDGRGTVDRDRAWQQAIAGDVLSIPMNDQIGALKQLGAHYPELDLGRVGVIGSELGGYLATLAVLIHPDVFAAAVASSPITDWALVDAASSERIMKTPEQNPAGYRRTNASTYAEQLKRPLLILSGVTDDRILFAHTLELIEALSAAGKQVELATLPAVPDTARELATTKLQLAFLREHLGPPVRPAVMPAPRSEEEEEEEERARLRSQHER
jgi:dipeptidyl-peptidase 4